MMDAVELETRGEVRLIALNRPREANALSSTLVRELRTSVAETARSGCRALIVTGRGAHFCAGADLREKRDGVDWLDDIRALFNEIAALDIPVIAAINGSALGGGCELAIACDLRLMSDGAEIGVPEIRFGALPFAGGTQRLPRLVGPARAKELCYLGRPLGAVRAEAIGLVNRVVAADALLEEAWALGGELARRAPDALLIAKRLIDGAMEIPLADGLRSEALLSRLLTDPERIKREIRRAADADATYADVFRRDRSVP